MKNMRRKIRTLAFIGLLAVMSVLTLSWVFGENLFISLTSFGDSSKGSPSECSPSDSPSGGSDSAINPGGTGGIPATGDIPILLPSPTTYHNQMAPSSADVPSFAGSDHNAHQSGVTTNTYSGDTANTPDGNGGLSEAVYRFL